MTLPAYSIDISPAVRRLLTQENANNIFVGDSEIVINFYDSGVVWPIPIASSFVLSIVGRETSYDSLADSSSFTITGTNELKFTINSTLLIPWLNGRRQAEAIVEVVIDDPGDKQTLARWPVIVFSQGS